MGEHRGLLIARPCCRPAPWCFLRGPETQSVSPFHPSGCRLISVCSALSDVVGSSTVITFVSGDYTRVNHTK